MSATTDSEFWAWTDVNRKVFADRFWRETDADEERKMRSDKGANFC
jgi:hypothetical protein